MFAVAITCAVPKLPTFAFPVVTIAFEPNAAINETTLLLLYVVRSALQEPFPCNTLEALPSKLIIAILPTAGTTALIVTIPAPLPSEETIVMLLPALISVTPI